MKGSIVIVSFFAIGCLCGVFGLLDIDFETYPVTKYVLYVLMFCVGLGLGADTNMTKQFKGLNWRYALLPVMTIIGTLAGSLLAWVVSRQYLPTDYLAIGSGFGYYSLSSIFISEMRGIELGTIALLANVMREIISMLFIPVAARKFGPLAAISMGGATTYDTTFPIISQSVEKKFWVVAIYQACILDLCVPFLVTLFCNI